MGQPIYLMNAHKKVLIRTRKLCQALAREVQEDFHRLLQRWQHRSRQCAYYRRILADHAECAFLRVPGKAGHVLNVSQAWVLRPYKVYHESSWYDAQLQQLALVAVCRPVRRLTRLVAIRGVDAARALLQLGRLAAAAAVGAHVLLLDHER